MHRLLDFLRTLLLLATTFKAGYLYSRPDNDSLIKVYTSQTPTSDITDKLYNIYYNHWRSSETYYYNEVRDLIEMSKSLGNDVRTASLYELFGLINRSLNRPDESAKAYFEGLKYAEKAKHPGWLSELHLSLGTLFCIKHSYPLAHPHLKRALAIAVNNNLRRHQAAALQQMGVYFGMQNLVDSSFYYQKQALNMTRPEDNIYDYSSQLLNLGITYKKMKLYKEALGIYDKTALIADTSHDDFLKAATIINSGWVYYEMKDYLKSKELANSGIAISQELAEPDFELDALDLLHKSYQALGLYKEAYLTMLKLKSLSDTLFNKDKIRQSRELNTRYEVGVKDALLVQEKLRVSRFRWIALIITISMSVIITLIWLFYRNVKRKNLELEKLNSQVETKNKELARLNHVKSVLFSVISHDLRGPLNTLRLFIDRLKAGKIQAEKAEIYLTEMGKDMNQAGQLIDNLLDWAKTQMEGYKTRLEVLNIREIAEKEIAKTNYLAETKNIKVSNLIDEEAEVLADKELTSIIIRNLLGNAIKFSSADSDVTLLYDPEKKSLVIKDKGSGISPEQIEKMRQGQINLSLRGTANEKGSGMGLMICQQLAGIMKGRIELQSETNKGTSAILLFGQ